MENVACQLETMASTSKTPQSDQLMHKGNTYPKDQVQLYPSPTFGDNIETATHLHKLTNMICVLSKDSQFESFPPSSSIFGLLRRRVFRET